MRIAVQIAVLMDPELRRLDRDGAGRNLGCSGCRVMSRLIVRDPRVSRKIIQDMKPRGRRQKQAGRRVDQWCKAGPLAGG